MTWHSQFEHGAVVHRKNRANGTAPPYRFKGGVCGSYYNPVTGESGACVHSYAEPGCIQIFPDYMLELVTPQGDE